jgi:hypothetical protein
VPTCIVTRLRSAGHDVLRLSDWIPTDAPDSSVIAEAQELDAILLSLNGDFANLVSYPPSGYGGIVAVQLRNRPSALPRLTDRLIEYLRANPDRGHYRGKLFVVEAHRMRIRV